MRFVYLATETRVVIGMDDITTVRQVQDSSRIDEVLGPGQN